MSDSDKPTGTVVIDKAKVDAIIDAIGSQSSDHADPNNPDADHNNCEFCQCVRLLRLTKLKQIADNGMMLVAVGVEEPDTVLMDMLMLGFTIARRYYLAEQLEKQLTV
jgi:hypothetical protein